MLTAQVFVTVLFPFIAQTWNIGWLTTLWTHWKRSDDRTDMGNVIDCIWYYNIRVNMNTLFCHRNNRGLESSSSFFILRYGTHCTPCSSSRIPGCPLLAQLVDADSDPVATSFLLWLSPSSRPTSLPSYLLHNLKIWDLAKYSGELILILILHILHATHCSLWSGIPAEVFLVATKRFPWYTITCFSDRHKYLSIFPQKNLTPTSLLFPYLHLQHFISSMLKHSVPPYSLTFFKLVCWSNFPSQGIISFGYHFYV